MSVDYWIGAFVSLLLGGYLLYALLVLEGMELRFGVANWALPATVATAPALASPRAWARSSACTS